MVNWVLDAFTSLNFAMLRKMEFAVVFCRLVNLKISRMDVGHMTRLVDE